MLDMLGVLLTEDMEEFYVQTGDVLIMLKNVN